MTVRLHVVYAGRGDSMVIEDGAHLYLLDGGPQGFTATSRSGAPFWQYYRSAIRDVAAAMGRPTDAFHPDAVIVSHAHEDHFGGIEAVFDRNLSKTWTDQPSLEKPFVFNGALITQELEDVADIEAGTLNALLGTFSFNLGAADPTEPVFQAFEFWNDNGRPLYSVYRRQQQIGLARTWTVDTSQDNLKSVLMFHRGTGMVFTGDSAGFLVAPFVAANIAHAPGNELSIFKVPHHGSLRNSQRGQTLATVPALVWQQYGLLCILADDADWDAIEMPRHPNPRKPGLREPGAVAAARTTVEAECAAQHVDPAVLLIALRADFNATIANIDNGTAQPFVTGAGGVDAGVIWSHALDTLQQRELVTRLGGMQVVARKRNRLQREELDPLSPSWFSQLNAGVLCDVFLSHLARRQLKDFYLSFAAANYVISADASHRHPNLETLAAIAGAAIEQHRQVRVFVTDAESVDIDALADLEPNWATGLEIRYLAKGARMVLDVTNPQNARDINLLDPLGTTLDLSAAMDVEGIRAQFRNNRGATIPRRRLLDETYLVGTLKGGNYLNLDDQGAPSVTPAQQSFHVDEAWTLALTNPALLPVPNTFDLIRLRRAGNGPQPSILVTLTKPPAGGKGHAVELPADLLGARQYLTTTAPYHTANLNDPALAVVGLTRQGPATTMRLTAVRDDSEVAPSDDEPAPVSLRVFLTAIGVAVAPITAGAVLSQIVGATGAAALAEKLTAPVLSRTLGWDADLDTSTVTYTLDEHGVDATAAALVVTLGTPLVFTLDGASETIAACSATLSTDADGAVSLSVEVTAASGVQVAESGRIPAPSRARPLDRYLAAVGMSQATWPNLTVGTLLSAFVGSVSIAEDLVARCPSFITKQGIAQWLIDHDGSEVDTYLTTTGGVEVVSARIALQTPAGITASIAGMAVGISELFLTVADARLPTMEVRLDATATIGSVRLDAISVLSAPDATLELEMAGSAQLADLIALLPGAPALGATVLPFGASLLANASFANPGIVIRQPAPGAEPYELAEVHGTLALSALSGWTAMLPAGFPTGANTSATVRVLNPLDATNRHVAVDVQLDVPVSGGKTLTAVLSAAPLPSNATSWSFAVSVFSDPLSELCTLTEAVTALGLGALVAPSNALPILSDALSKLVLGELTLTLAVPESGPPTVAFADIGLMMLAEWDLLPGIVRLVLAQLELHYDGTTWSGSVAADAVLGGSSVVSAAIDLPTPSRVGAISFHSADPTLTIARMAQICGLGDLSTVPVVGNVLSIAISDFELVLAYPPQGTTLALGSVGFSVVAGPQALGPLSLTAVGMSIEHRLIDLGGVAAGTTRFRVEASWGEAIIATLAYDGHTAELAAGLRMIGPETVGDLLSKLLGSTVVNALLPVIKDFKVRDGSAVLDTAHGFALTSCSLRLDTSAALSFGAATLTDLNVRYAAPKGDVPTTYELVGRLVGPGTDATVSIDCIAAANATSVSASVMPTPGGSGFTCRGMLAMLNLADPPVATPPGAPALFDIKVSEAHASFTLSPFQLETLSLAAVTTESLPLLASPRIDLTGLALQVDYDRAANPTTSGWVTGQLRLGEALVTVKYVMAQDGQPEYQASAQPVTEHTPDFATLIGAGAYDPGYGIPANLGIPTTLPMALITVVARPGKFVDVSGYATTTQWPAAIGGLHLTMGAVGGRVRVQAAEKATDPATYALWLYGRLDFNGFVSTTATLSFGTGNPTVLSAAATSNPTAIDIPTIASALGSPWTGLVPAETAVRPAFSAAAYVYLDFTAGTFALYGTLQSLGSGALLSVTRANTRDYVFMFGLAQPFSFGAVWASLAALDAHVAVRAANASILDYSGTVSDLTTDLATVAASARLQGVSFSAPFADLPALNAELAATTPLPKGFSFFAALDLTKGALTQGLGRIVDTDRGSPSVLLWGTVDKTTPANTVFAAEVDVVLLGGSLAVAGSATYRPNTPETLVVHAVVGVTLTPGSAPYAFNGDLTVGETATRFVLSGTQPPQIPTPFGAMTGITLTAPQLAIAFDYPTGGPTTSTVTISGGVALALSGSTAHLQGLVHFVDGVPKVAAVDLTASVAVTDLFADGVIQGSYPQGYAAFELLRGSLYYAATTSAPVTVGGTTYQPGYHISAQVAFFGAQFTADVEIASSGLLLTGSYVGQIDFVFVQLTGYSEENGTTHPGPTARIDTRTPNATIYQVGCGISVFKTPFLVTTFAYDSASQRYSGTASYNGTILGFVNPGVSFTYDDTNGLRITHWPLAPEIGDALDYAKMLEDASSASDPCGKLAGLIFDKAIVTDFALGLKQDGAIANGALPVTLTGTYTLKVAGAELFTLAMPDMNGSITAPASLDMAGLGAWVAKTIVENAVAIGRSLLEDMVGGQKALKILIAHFAITYASKELLADLICRGADSDNVQDATNTEIDTSTKQISDELKNLFSATQAVAAATTLAAAVAACDLAVSALASLGTAVAAALGLIAAAWAFLTGARQQEKANAEAAQAQAQAAVDAARAKVKALLAMQGTPSVTFTSDTTVQVAWTTANLPNQAGIDYGGYKDVTYTVDIATDAAFTNIVATGTGDPSFTATNAAFAASNTVYARVSAHYGAYTGTPIVGSGFHTLPVPAPASVSQVHSAAADAIDVTVATVTLAKSYNVELVDAAHGNAVAATASVAQPVVSSATVLCRIAIGDLKAGTAVGASLLARAQAVGDPSTHRASDFTAAATSSALPTLGPPSSLALRADAAGVTATWNPLPPASVFAARTVDADGAPIGQQPSIAFSGNGCSLTGAGIVEGATVRLEVRPVLDTAVGLWSAPATLVVHILTAPANPLLTYVGGELHASWTIVPGADHYAVDLSTGNQSVATAQPDSNGCQFGPSTGLKLIPQATYTVTIKAMAGAAVGPPASASATVPPAQPPGPGLQEVAGSPYVTGSYPGALAFSGDGALLAVACGSAAEGGIWMFAVDRDTGALTAVPGSPYPTGKGPSHFAFSSVGGLLATANGQDKTVSVFNVELSSGKLAPFAHSPFPSGDHPFAIAFSPDGALLAVTNVMNVHNVSLYRVDRDNGTITMVAGSPFATGPADAYSVAFSPDGSLLAIGLLIDNSNVQDTIAVWSIDRRTLVVKPVPGSPFVTGKFPYQLAFSRGGRLLASADAGSNSMSVFSVNPSTGALVRVAGSPFQVWMAHSVGFSPDGRLLATANQQPDGLSVFAVDEAAAAITEVPGSPFGVRDTPYALAFSPVAPFLATVNDLEFGYISMYTLRVDTSPAAARITSVSPADRVAAGFGQLLFIRGINMGNVVVFTQNGGDAAPQWVSGANPTLAVVRLPLGGKLVPGPATVRVTDAGGQVSTQAFPITISATPGTPIITAVTAVGGGPIKAGATVYITAEGMDTDASLTTIEWLHPSHATLSSRGEYVTGNPGSVYSVATTVPAITDEVGWTLSLRIRVGSVDSDPCLYALPR